MRRTPHGFTLIEVLMALAISSILFVMLYSAIDQAFDAKLTAENATVPWETGPAVLNLIASDLRAAYFYNIAGNDVFLGNDDEMYGVAADRLNFITTKDARTPGPDETTRKRSDLCEVGYWILDDGSERLKLYRREGFFIDDAVDQNSHDVYQLVCDRLKSINYRYFGRTKNEEAENSGAEDSEESFWWDEWSAAEAKVLPRAVRIDLEIWAESDRDIRAARRGEARPSYAFYTVITLPQAQDSDEAVQKIADWDGTWKNPREATTGGGGARRAGQGGAASTTTTTTGQRGTAGRPATPGPNAQNFLNLLKQGGQRPAGGGAGGFPFTPR